MLDWRRKRDKEDRQVIGLDVIPVQFGWPDRNASSSQPRRWSLGGQMDVRSDRIVRLLFCLHESVLVVLHGSIKKTQKTSPDDLAIARRSTEDVTGRRN